jgi:hypothetical protein
MRKYEKYEVINTRKRVVSISCDRCEEEMPLEEDRRGPRDDLTVKREVGNVYPEGGTTHVWYIEDLCQKCRLQLYSLLMAWGVSITHGETDYW